MIDENATPADWECAKRRQKDADATWTKEYDRNYFGYKLSVNTDRRYKQSRKIETDIAIVHDCEHFDAVFDRTNTSADVYADRGYSSQARESDQIVNGDRPQIQLRVTSKRKFSEC